MRRDWTLLRARFLAMLAVLAVSAAALAAAHLIHAPTPKEPDAPVEAEQTADVPEGTGAAPTEKEKPADEADAETLLRTAAVIEHAMGEADGVAMLNCLEGFEQAYANGVRVFEADFRLTRDDAVVLRHDWRAGWQEGISEREIPTLEEFLASPILGRYTPLSFRNLLELMERYPDVCIVTDSKYVDAEIVTKEFEAMVADAHELGLTYLFDRMAVQVYSKLMFSVVDNIYHFPHYIYTLYNDNFRGTDEDFLSRADFCRENGILGVTMWHTDWRESFSPLAKGYGLMTFVHTVNDAAYAQSLRAAGVSAVYTDSLLPADLADAAEQETEAD